MCVHFSPEKRGKDAHHAHHSHQRFVFSHLRTIQAVHQEHSHVHHAQEVWRINPLEAIVTFTASGGTAIRAGHRS